MCTHCHYAEIRRGRGAHNQVLCLSCWGELLRRHRARKRGRGYGDTLALLSMEFGVSVSAISQKIKYLRE